MNEINVISVYLEVKNAEVFGGEGSTGYVEYRTDATLEKSNKPDLYEYAKAGMN